VNKPKPVSTESGIDTGGFAEAVHTALGQRGMTTVEFAEALGVTYEHARRLLNSMAFPSTLLLEKICRILGMDKAETARILVADRIRRKYGDLSKLPEPLDRNRRFAKIESKLSSLTSDQFHTLNQLIDMMIKANGTS
jgi:transcriptional regulator with XRE-family HTH domain